MADILRERNALGKGLPKDNNIPPQRHRELRGKIVFGVFLCPVFRPGRLGGERHEE
jgi:hypothetical protein